MKRAKVHHRQPTVTDKRPRPPGEKGATRTVATVQEYSAPISYLLTPIQGRCHITLKFTSAERTHTDTLKLSTLWIWKSDKQKGQDSVHTKAAVLIHSVQKYTQTQATSTNSTKPTENPIQGIEKLRRIDQAIEPFVHSPVNTLILLSVCSSGLELHHIYTDKQTM